MVDENKNKAENKKTVEKENKKAKGNSNKIKDLKIELLKNPTKRRSIKKEIARLLTMENKTNLEASARSTPAKLNSGANK